jgi:NADPH2:quinone reductase
VRGILVTQFGPPDVLVPADLPEPDLGPGQALIDVEFVSITFVETQVRAGNPPNPAMAPRLPYVPGNGVGGRVSAVGPSVDASLRGMRVVCTTGGSGGYAERVAVDAAGLTAVPDSLDLDVAVALLADGRTALSLMQLARVQPGETVLVEAAAGGVGSLLVQLVHNAGADVVAAAGGARKLEAAAALGVPLKRAVDYVEPGWADRVRAELGGVDLVFDGVGGPIGQASFELLRPGGRFYAFGRASGTFTQLADATVAQRGVTVLRGTPISPSQMLELTRAALAEASAGRVHPLIGQRFALEQAARAHAAIEARQTLGKSLLVTH